MRRCLPLLCLVLAAEPAAADLRADWSACQQNELAEFSRTREVRQDAAHQYCYGLGYAFGWFEGGKQLDIAAQWYSAAAQAGHVGAQTVLGYAYEKGYGVSRDATTAAAWYRRAANGGHPDGMFNLSRLLDQGLGVPMDKDAARQWLQRAASLGSAEARTRLESMARLESLAGNLESAAPATAAPDPLADYLDGLEALRTGDYANAARAFDKALDAAGSDTRFVLARGVAATLGGDPVDGARHFERYERLGGPGREGTLWKNTALGMAGHVFPGGGPQAPRSLQGQFDGNDLQCQSGSFSLPGHLVQGGDDYPTDFASHVVHDVGWGYVKARCNGELPPRGVLADAVARAGRWFAYRNLVRGELAPAHRARAIVLFDAGRFDDALLYAGFARKAYPDDAGMIHLVGRAYLALGRPVSARRELTIALTLNTRLAGAYLDRARAAASLGDVRRAGADLDIAEALDATAAAPVRRALAGTLAAGATAVPADLVKPLLDAARRDADAGRVLDRAQALHRAAVAVRTRFDEVYQDRLRALEADVDLFPGDPDRRVALAAWIGDESALRGESVEPRRPLVPYRWQLSAERELHAAIAHLDGALGLDANHVGALLTKALVLSRLQREDEAEPLADRAIALAPDDPEALSLYAYYKGRRANALNARAAALRQTDCSSSSRTETRYDGVWEVTTTTCYPPTAAELALADALDAEAAELRQRSRAAMDKAIAATTGTYMGYLLEAEAARWSNRVGDAVDALKRAIALDPAAPRAQEELARLYAQAGQSDLAVEQRIVADTFIHTTAAPLLERAWQRIERTDWTGARSDLERAMHVDPADARAPAYLGVAHELQGMTTEAAAFYRAALALEQARLSLDEPAPGKTPPARDAAEFGLALALQSRLADLAVANDDVDASLQLLVSVADQPARFAPGWQAVEMFSAMLPGIRAAGASPDAPRNGASLVAAAYQGLGQLYQSLGRADDAVEAFRAAVALGPVVGRPKIGGADGSTNYAGEADAAAGDARVALAGELLRAGDLDGAQQALDGIGYGQLTDAGRVEANVLSNNLAKLHQRRRDAATIDPSASTRHEADAALEAQERQLRQRLEARIRTLRAQGLADHARAEEENLERQLDALRDAMRATDGADSGAGAILRERAAALRASGQQPLADVFDVLALCDGTEGAILVSPGAHAAPHLAGDWLVQPTHEWRYVPGAGRLELRADGRFDFRPSAPGTKPRDGAWAVLQDAQLVIVDTACLADSWYVQTQPDGQLELTAPDAVKYVARRASGN